ncbi:hypothetical protein ElyMa_002266500 [Elysia marginata]|uniref:Uncharacterized protein n=1 Tax=Elysia marginata TaxID=1093978 RepID=A0AAV4G247_9GAST|nr:hypothetical protein ElyMa_002266500 [Elysia marginata]
MHTGLQCQFFSKIELHTHTASMHAHKFSTTKTLTLRLICQQFSQGFLYRAVMRGITVSTWIPTWAAGQQSVCGLGRAVGFGIKQDCKFGSRPRQVD